MEFATGAMGSLLNKLGELLKEEYKLQEGVREQVRSLSRELETMHAALRKVGEVPREQLDPLVKLWARDVRELSYDMEDILVRAEDGPEATPNPHRLKKLVKKTGNLFSEGKARHQIAVAIEDINKQLQEVTNRRGRYPPSVPAASTPMDPRLRFLYTEATELVGIDGKRDQELIKMLSEGDDVSKKKLKIVSVVGFGGLGKTTLVRAVQAKIKGDFDCSAFVSVGRNPDVKKVFKDILLELNCTNSNLTMLDERQLINKLREFLKDKRYIVVIDDIWDKKLWGVIKLAFSDRNNLGSRLITTTRKGSISQACCSSTDDKVYKMEPLSDDDSQRLFYQRIFSDRNGCPPELEQVSIDILKKCGGVPLAIITIASLLASKQIKAKDEWYTLLNSIGHGLTEDDSVEEMQRILSFSYYDLPYELKTCLLYLSTFPEDYEIRRDRLIWRWIAEGFIQCKRQQTSLFELGESYFNELINRSMIQPADIDDKEGIARACRVHDMVLDLICALSSEENFVTILDGTEESSPNSQSKVRRLSLQNSKVDATTPLNSVSQVRSITVFQPAINLMPPLSSFRVLRVLDLECCDFGESSPLNLRHVGNLFHLRYLGLVHTCIRELPANIGKLQFLQVLDVRGNHDLEELPSTVVKLRSLMCLLVDHNCARLPDGIGNLTSMEVLDKIFAKAWPNLVKELRNLTRLRELNIHFAGSYSKELEEAFVESLCNLHSVQTLEIGGCFGSMDLLGERWVPPRHLRILRLHVIEVFSTLPAWDPSLLSDLSELQISVEELRQEDLQILGRLPALRYLKIWSTYQTQRLLLGADWFPCVMFISVVCESSGQIMFQRGALPRAQEVEFPFDVRMAKDDGNSDFDSGLGNLRDLRHVSVTIIHCRATEGEADEAEAAMRHVIDAHPNHPTIEIEMWLDITESDEDDKYDGEESMESDDDDDDICDDEKSAESDDDDMYDGEESADSDGDDDEHERAHLERTEVESNPP